MNIKIQLIIIIGYFAILVLVGWFTRKYSKSSSDYLIAGRNLGLILCTFSIVGEWLGGMTTIGAAEKAYVTGYFPVWYNLSTATGMVLFGFFLAAIYRKNHVHTVGEMMEKLFNRQVRIIVSFCFAAAFLILTYIQLQTVGGVAAQVLGVKYGYGVIIAGVLITVYVYFGGMHSIAISCFINVILLYSTILTLFAIVLSKVGGFSGLFSRLEMVLPPAQAMSFKNPFSQGGAAVVSWLIGGILAGFASQASIQPVFSARDIKTAQRSSFLSALFIAPMGFLVSTLAIAVRTGAFGGQPPSVKETLPFLVLNTQVFPTWLSGLAAAGIIAAILSTVSAVMFAVSTILTKDLYNLLINPAATDKHLLKISRRFVLLAGIISIPPAVFFTGGILDTAYITYAIRGSAAIAVLLGVAAMKNRIPRPTPFSVIIAMITATSASILFSIFRSNITAVLGFTIDKVYAAVFFSLASILIVSVIQKTVSKQ